MHMNDTKRFYIQLDNQMVIFTNHIELSCTWTADIIFFNMRDDIGRWE